MLKATRNCNVPEVCDLLSILIVTTMSIEIRFCVNRAQELEGPSAAAGLWNACPKR